MDTINAEHHSMIRRAVMQRPDATVETSFSLWQGLRVELISVIGEGGFRSLFSRSLHLASQTFPWLLPSDTSAPVNPELAELKICFEGRDIAEATEASIALLTTFITILIVLIGEHLTISILRSAWGDDAVDTPRRTST